MGLAGVAEMGGRRTLSPPCRGRATCCSGRPDVRGDRVREETDPEIRRGGRPGHSRLLPSGSGGESAREDVGVAPFIGTCVCVTCLCVL